MIFLQYDKATGAVKGLLRPSAKALAKCKSEADFLAFAQSLPMAEGANAVTGLADEPKDEAGNPIPVHLLTVTAEGVSFNG